MAIAGGFYFSDTRDKDIKEDATNRSIDINQFLRQQCARDDFRDQIIIGALEDAKRRAQASIQDPAKLYFEVNRLQYSIDSLRSQQGECQRTLPKVNS